MGGLEAKNPVTIVQTEGGKQVDFAPHFDAIRAELNRNMDFISKNYALRLEVLEIFQKLKGEQDETKGQILEGVKKNGKPNKNLGRSTIRTPRPDFISVGTTTQRDDPQGGRDGPKCAAP